MHTIKMSYREEPKEGLDRKGRAMKVYGRCGISSCANEMNCGVGKWVKRNTEVFWPCYEDGE